MNTITKSEFALMAMKHLSATGRSSRVVGWGDPPATPYHENGWKLEVLRLESESTIPTEVMTRLNILRGSGVQVRQILIAHEDPKIQPKALKIPKEVIDAAFQVLPILGSILSALASVLGALVMVTGQVVLFFLMLDPVVIVVLEDKTWLEIAKWYD